MMDNVDAILFDWDGTLVLSEQACFAAFEKSMRHFGIPFSYEIYKRHFALDWRRMYETLQLPEDRWKEAESLWMRYYGERVPDPAPGARELLAGLRHGGYQMGVVSSGSRERVISEIEAHGFRDMFGTVICGEDVTRPKPCPEGLEKAMHALACIPQHCCYVGDHPDDMEMGKRAGVRTIGVRSRFPGSADLQSLSPDYCFDSLNAVADVFPRLRLSMTPS